MQPYLDLMRHVLEKGHDKSDRTGTGTRSVLSWPFSSTWRIRSR
jgi:thymidylate synthase